VITASRSPLICSMRSRDSIAVQRPRNRECLRTTQKNGHVPCSKNVRLLVYSTAIWFPTGRVAHTSFGKTGEAQWEVRYKGLEAFRRAGGITGQVGRNANVFWWRFALCLQVIPSARDTSKNRRWPIPLLRPTNAPPAASRPPFREVGPAKTKPSAYKDGTVGERTATNT